MPESTHNVPIDAIFAGGIGILGEEGHRSGIFKRRIEGEVRVVAEGIVGDQHADTRVHGGPEKAVHHFATENYATLATGFPHVADALVPGSFGENIATVGLDERSVHIGDIYRAGSVVLQVSQPRSPCWKINHRFSVEGLSLLVARERITGWYYRVLQPGTIRPGDILERLERANDRFSISEFWQVVSAHVPEVDDMQALSAVEGLADDWKRRLTERARWIRERRVAAQAGTLHR
ncbi:MULTISPECIES: MOSC domain-containing protein [unclassified Cupriavidus]|uniref:MOSC domain-containing protein n=1 Tax=unclassified Cupriavidus TaxID=2640874 RepID=UPI0003FCF4BB|nr:MULTISPECIES: MOSC domain-containing protein [unclassified Cupriavidus]MBP0638055.1 MOSC domain-containing protein [Cupriavidus sp. AcVe19-6a]